MCRLPHVLPEQLPQRALQGRNPPPLLRCNLLLCRQLLLVHCKLLQGCHVLLPHHLVAPPLVRQLRLQASNPLCLR